MSLGLMERDGQRISHVRHHREVQQFRDIDFIVQPPGVGAIVHFNEFGKLPAVAFLVASHPAGCLGHRDFGLLLQPIPLQSALGPTLVRGGNRPKAPPIAPPSGKTSHQKFAAKCKTGVTSPGCHRESARGYASSVSARQCSEALNRSTERCTSASASARPTQSAALTNLPGSSALYSVKKCLMTCSWCSGTSPMSWMCSQR